MQGAVQDGEVVGQLLLSRVREPGLRLVDVGEWLEHIDNRCSTGCYEARLRLRFSLMLALSSESCGAAPALRAWR